MSETRLCLAGRSEVVSFFNFLNDGLRWRMMHDFSSNWLDLISHDCSNFVFVVSSNLVFARVARYFVEKGDKEQRHCDIHSTKHTKEKKGSQGRQIRPTADRKP